MAELPSASVSIDDEGGAFGGGTGYAVVLTCVERNADITPRVFASAKSLLAQHGYSQGVDYVAHHLEGTGSPVIVVGIPSATAGTVGRQNNALVFGTSVITIAAGAAGFLEETNASVTVVTGGTIGTNGISFALSLDGGLTTKLVRLGTAASYTIPYVGAVISFAAGTLIAGDLYTFSTTAPMWDGAGIAAAKTALAAQLKLARSFMVIGDVPNSTLAGAVVSAANGYETADDRFVYARIGLRDRLPLASKSKVLKTMVGAPSVTFAAGGNTVTRAAGSFIAEGFLAGDVVTISGTASNNASRAITVLTATVMTFAAGVVSEGPIGTAAIVGSEGLVFAATTITRSTGSWLSDGFRVGDSITVTGSVSNNYTKAITVLTATVLTFASGGVAETIGSYNVTATKGETMAAWVSTLDAAFAAIDGQKRIDIGIGRLHKASPITGWSFRRSVQWPVSVREYQHDLQIPAWRKSDGPLDGWRNTDANGTVVEFDERVDGGALAGRFTCARTFSNGPNGAFCALSLTRASEGSLLSRTHNMAVANLACTVAQTETENAIGQVLVLKADGTAAEASLGVIEGRVNSALQIALLQDRSEGPRASSAVWRASRTNVLNIPGAELTGVLDLRLNGTLEKITTTVRIQTAG